MNTFVLSILAFAASNLAYAAVQITDVKPAFVPDYQAITLTVQGNSFGPKNRILINAKECPKTKYVSENTLQCEYQAVAGETIQLSVEDDLECIPYNGLLQTYSKLALSVDFNLADVEHPIKYQVNGGVPPYAFDVVDGLTIADGKISGKTSGKFQVFVRDSLRNAATQEIQFNEALSAKVECDYQVQDPIYPRLIWVGHVSDYSGNGGKCTVLATGGVGKYQYEFKFEDNESNTSFVSDHNYVTVPVNFEEIHFTVVDERGSRWWNKQSYFVAAEPVPTSQEPASKLNKNIFYRGGVSFIPESRTYGRDTQTGYSRRGYAVKTISQCGRAICIATNDPIANETSVLNHEFKVKSDFGIEPEFFNTCSLEANACDYPYAVGYKVEKFFEHTKSYVVESFNDKNESNPAMGKKGYFEKDLSQDDKRNTFTLDFIVYDESPHKSLRVLQTKSGFDDKYDSLYLINLDYRGFSHPQQLYASADFKKYLSKRYPEVLDFSLDSSGFNMFFQDGKPIIKGYADLTGNRTMSCGFELDKTDFHIVKSECGNPY